MPLWSSPLSHPSLSPGCAGSGSPRPPPARRDRHRNAAGEIARYLGAVSIVLVGVVHAQQYYDAYFSVVPTIGPLFLLSFIGTGVVGAALFAPVRRLAPRAGEAILPLPAPGATGVPPGTFPPRPVP